MHAPPIGFCVLVVHGTYCGLPRPPYQPESCDPCRADGSQLGRRPSHAPLGAVTSAVVRATHLGRRSSWPAERGSSNVLATAADTRHLSPACGEIDIASREHVHVRFFRNGRPDMLPACHPRRWAAGLAFLRHHLQLHLHLQYLNHATRLVIFSRRFAAYPTASILIPATPARSLYFRHLRSTAK